MSLYLITGGQGFIGRHLTRELIGAGHVVRIIDSLVEQAHGGKPAARDGPVRTNGSAHGVATIFAGQLLAGEPPLVFEDGLQRRDFVQVGDVAHAFRLAMEEPAAAGEIVNIGSARAGDIRHCFADIDKARVLLGFAPQHQLEQALGDLVGWVEKQQQPMRSPDAHGELVARGLVL